jgi:hypothetical protein
MKRKPAVKPPVFPKYDAAEEKRLGIGKANGVKYTINLPTRSVELIRCLEHVDNLEYDPENLRLRTKIIKAGIDPTQANLHNLLWEEVKDDLAPSLLVSRGLHIPILVQGKKTKEGNRRLRCFREHRTEHQVFGLIPVEYLPDDLTEAEMQLILSLRHSVRPKPWDSREQAYDIQCLLKYYPAEDVAKIVGRTPQWVKNYISASMLFDEFDAFARRNPNVGEEQHRNRDFFTYFLKIANRPKFMHEVMAHKEEKNKVFAMMLNGQFNDCLNIDNIGKVWDNPQSRHHLEIGGSFGEAMRLYNKDCSVRRAKEIWPAIKKSLSGVKTFTKGDLRRLALDEGIKDLNTLKLLQKELEKVMIQVDEYKKLG